MKKQKVIGIIALIVAIVAVGVCLLMWNKGKNANGKADKMMMLTDMKDVTYVQYKNADGTVTLVKEDDVWKSEEKEALVLVGGYVDEKVAGLCNIKGLRVVDATKAQCGLDKPVYALTIKNSQKEVTLVLGVDEDGTCYAMLENKEEIYEVSQDVMEILDMSIENFVAPDEDMHSTIQDEPDETLMDEDIATNEDVDDDIDEEEVITEY